MKRKKLNIALLGETKAGKTILISVYSGHEFQQNNLSTIDVDYIDSKIKMKDGNEVLVNFYDTAGQEHYHSISVRCLRSSDTAAIFYDITDRKSFEGIENWYQDIRKYGNIPVILIACKCDLEKERAISKEEAEKYANKKNISYIETSSKHNININEAIEKIANEAYEYSKIKEIKEIESLITDKKNNIKEKEGKKKKEKERKEKEKKKKKLYPIKSVNKDEFNEINKIKKEDLFDYHKQKLIKYINY